MGAVDVIAALLPSVGVGLLFWFVIRAVLGADRRERAAMAELDRQDAERERQDAERAGSAAPERNP